MVKKMDEVIKDTNEEVLKIIRRSQKIFLWQKTTDFDAECLGIMYSYSCFF
jgi:hypothetical protein